MIFQKTVGKFITFHEIMRVFIGKNGVKFFETKTFKRKELFSSEENHETH